ncbi:MAG: hypothetical protein J5496_00175, partial [Lachnospiraceae bacterium]|nr:hypothetical protein [Lachnospiraceae bacterium]
MNKKKLAAIIAAAVLVVGGGTGVFLATRNKNPEPPVETTVSSEQPTTSAPTESDVAETDYLEAARDYLKAMYIQQPQVSSSSYKLVNAVKIFEDTFEVEWSVKVKEGPEGYIEVVKGENQDTVKIDGTNPEAIKYTLTATIKDPKTGKTVELSFDREVPAYKVLSFSEYAAAKDGDPVTVAGVVTGIIAKSKANTTNGLYIQGEDGGYYVYNLSQDPLKDLGLERGMTVKVSGVRSTYNGTYEITNASVDILKAELTEVIPPDYTEIYAAAADLTDAALVEKQSMLVTIKGVEVTGQNTGSGYYRFKLGELESYLRVSSSACPLTVDEQDAFIASHSEHTGWLADVTGVICVYNGAFYLTPCSDQALVLQELPERSDEDMCKFEAEYMKLPSTVSEAGVIELPTEGRYYKQVAIAWTSDSAYAVVGEDGNLIVTIPEKPETVTLTAVFTAGEASYTQEYQIMLLPADMTEADIIEVAYALGKDESLGGPFTLTGVITKINTPYSDQFKNITVTIKVNGTERTIQCYRMKDDNSNPLTKGDEIQVTGNIKNYNGTVEFDAGCTYVLIKKGDGEVVDLSGKTAAEIMALAEALADGDSLESKVTLKGIVKRIDYAYKEGATNISLTMDVLNEDGTKLGKSIYCYRLEGADIATVGPTDKISVTGIIKNYKGTIEFDAGCTFVIDEKFVRA